MGTRAAIRKTKQQLVKCFNSKEIGKLDKYVEARFERKIDKYTVLQRRLINDLESHFNIDNRFQAPGTPGKVLMEGTSKPLNEDKLSIYYSGI